MSKRSRRFHCPTGDFGMFAVACVPPSWFKLTHPRLFAWAQGESLRIHFQTGRKPVLTRRDDLRHPDVMEAA